MREARVKVRVKGKVEGSESVEKGKTKVLGAIDGGEPANFLRGRRDPN
jgi:ribonuclease PH